MKKYFVLFLCLALIIPFTITHLLILTPNWGSYDDFHYLRYSINFDLYNNAKLTVGSHRIVRYPIILFCRVFNGDFIPFDIHPIQRMILIYVFLNISVVLSTFFLALKVFSSHRYQGYIQSLPCAIFVVIFPALQTKGDAMADLLFTSFINMALLFLIEHARTGKRIKTSLYLSILFFILSYATKEFALLFLPAFLIGLFIAKKRNSLIVFIVGFSMYLILEVIVFKHLFGVDAGRLGILRITYDKSGLLDVLSGPGLATLFERYAIFGLEKFVFLISAMIASLYLFRYFLNKKGDIGFLLCCISLLSFLLTITFSVKSINPITPLFTFYERYLLPAYPLIAICIFYFIEHWTLKLFPLRSQNFIRYGIIALVLITCFKPNNLSDIEQNFKNFKSSLDSKKNPTNALSWNKIVNAQNSFISALSDDKVILSKQLSSEEIKYRLFIAAKDESYYMIRCDKLTNFMFIISKKLILNSSLKKLSWCEKVKNIKSNQFEMVNIYWKSPFQLHLQKNFKFQPRE